MKKPISLFIILTLQLLCFAKTYGQTQDSIFNAIEFPKDLTVSIKEDNRYFKDFDRNLFADITFSISNSSVSYFVFRYNLSDSTDFWNAMDKYIMMSNCLYERNPDLDKNFATFIKGGYYFVLELCPCKTIKYPDCGVLASTLSEWLRKN